MKTGLKEVTAGFIDKLWERFLLRVPYARIYNELNTQKRGKVINDHIAFRTLNTHTGEQPQGIKAISHLLELLEYKPEEKYLFPKKKLSAVYYQHPEKQFPKIFVSQLEVENLPGWAQTLINQHVCETPYLLADKSIELMNSLKVNKYLTEEAAQILVNDLVNYFQRPWKIPLKEAILKLNDISHYAAWVLLHGNSVSHFSALVNYPDTDNLFNIESTCKELTEFGIPMKSLIEGDRGSKLRQSATHAIIEEVDVVGDNGIEKILWPYAYYGLVQRGFADNGYPRLLFQGFLVNQSMHLFDLTNTLDN